MVVFSLGKVVKLNLIIPDGDGVRVNPDLKVVIMAGNSYYDENDLKRREKRETKGKRILLGDKGFSDLGGRKVIEYTLDHIVSLGMEKNSLGENNIYIIAGEANLESIAGKYNFNGIVQKDGNSYSDNLRLGLSTVKLGKDEIIYFLYCDHPFTRLNDHKYFLWHGAKEIVNNDLVLAVATADGSETFWDICNDDFVHTKELSFRMTGMTLARPHQIDLSLFEKGYSARKLNDFPVLLNLIGQVLTRANGNRTEAKTGILAKIAYKIGIATDLVNMHSALVSNKLYRKFGYECFRQIRNHQKGKESVSGLMAIIADQLLASRGVSFVPVLANCYLDTDWNTDLMLFNEKYLEILRKSIELELKFQRGEIPNEYTPKDCSSIMNFYKTYQDKSYLRIKSFR
jgi:hypothetical protein